MGTTTPNAKKHTVGALADARVDQIFTSHREDKRIRSTTLHSEGVLDVLVGDLHRKLRKSLNALCRCLPLLPELLERSLLCLHHAEGTVQYSRCYNRVRVFFHCDGLRLDNAI